VPNLVLYTNLLGFEILNNIFFLLGYISNVNSFPQPLSPEEEQHYLDLLKKGDEKQETYLLKEI